MKTLLSDREAATLLGCSKSTVWRWAAEGVISQPLRIGGISRWKLADLEAVIAQAEAQREPLAA
jgi:excisionase family DNA binding protein